MQVQKGLLIRTQKVLLKFRPTKKLKIILRCAPDVLGPNPSLVEFGNYLRAETGCLKEVPKVAMYVAAHEKSDSLQLKYDKLNVQYEQARKGGAQRWAGPSGVQQMAAISCRSSVGLWRKLLIICTTLLVFLSARGSGSIRSDDTMEVEGSSVTRTTELFVMLQTLFEEPLLALGARGVDSAVSGNTTISGVEAALPHSLQKGDEYDTIICAAHAKAMNLQHITELEDCLKQSQDEIAALGRTSHERQAELAAACAEKSVLASKHNLYMRKHFVTTVALKGSQIQVEKRDEERKSFFGTFANMVSKVLTQSGLQSTVDVDQLILSPDQPFQLCKS
ncbi:hypothetical protein FKP32DRAFT_1599628 [Trametes sanguinea]|nr:hypothetical protein FKP32DRAFT_1607745 [Trametes sanguinea]KAI9059703.1 hypothetical protein FKP32DRAFT_1605883 [Trametes sanguinea]KAI9069698.1 hypothetical protein FKP32DRAFT_1599750 [Trametes sanguinea]KAI9069898.1 hypothetical protein FKP32DRAFT_1599628 [Trametes sanguinea]